MREKLMETNSKRIMLIILDIATVRRVRKMIISLGIALRS